MITEGKAGRPRVPQLSHGLKARAHHQLLPEIFLFLLLFFFNIQMVSFFFFFNIYLFGCTGS